MQLLIAPTVAPDSAAQLLQVLADRAKPKQLVHVDMTADMKKHGLFHLYPIDSWPSTMAVREIATWKANRIKCGADPKAFVYINLKKFLPSFCPEHLVVALTDEDQARNSDASVVDKAAKGHERRLDISSWQMAFDRCSSLISATPPCISLVLCPQVCPCGDGA